MSLEWLITHSRYARMLPRSLANYTINISCASTARMRVTGSARIARLRDSHHKIPARQTTMAIVAGVDFGTLSVRVSIVDSDRGILGSAISQYPLHRKKEYPEYATQSHEDHMRALAMATRQ